MRWPQASPSAVLAVLVALGASTAVQAAPIVVVGDSLTQETWSRVETGTWCVCFRCSIHRAWVRPCAALEGRGDRLVVAGMGSSLSELMSDLLTPSSVCTPAGSSSTTRTFIPRSYSERTPP